MNKATRVLLTAAIALFGAFGFAGVASAQEVQGSDCRNDGVAATGNEGAGTADSGSATQTNDGNCLNSGDSDGQVDQEGSASSGDGVAGQVAGVVSAGDASVDATNRSDDVDVETGNANGTNDANLDVRAGIAFLLPDGVAGDETQGSDCRSEGVAPTGNEAGGVDSGNANQANGSNCVNEGDADGAIGQAADAASGDGVGGQVIGVVTSAGGSADLVLDNESSDSDVNSGDGDFSNTADEFSDAGIFFTIAPD
jgi:hypothetical protein